MSRSHAPAPKPEPEKRPAPAPKSAAGQESGQGPRHAGFWSDPDWHRLAGQLEISGSVRLLAAN